jgi:hypothetical protein
MKVHEWLSELNSHDIYNHAGISADLQEKTGHAPPWEPVTVARQQAAIDARGVGGHCDGAPDELTVTGWVVAATLAEKLCGFHSAKMGRGRIFRESVDALKEAGL